MHRCMIISIIKKLRNLILFNFEETRKENFPLTEAILLLPEQPAIGIEGYAPTIRVSLSSL